MTQAWESDDAPDPVRIGPAGWVRVVLRGLVLGIVVFGGLFILLTLRLIERPLFGMARPLTPHITQTVCRLAFVILGMRFSATGTPIHEQGAVVANHSSWLDIFALNAAQRIYFVSKSEVAKWPGIGWLARATGTLFTERNPSQARQQMLNFQLRLLAGHQLLFFPEGTSTDGLRVLPFKTTLFQAFFTDELRAEMRIQPVTVVYGAPAGQPARFYGWWGDMDFGSHLLKTLSAAPGGTVLVHYHPPVAVADFANRKALAARLEEIVRSAHPTAVAQAAE
ncbi:1-acyl-sn-glycerol-3-phosphate acyltransferase [Thalassococcus sp. S3]|uniref:lysophospholipid acyltransferase family protein n=1 Tax=Thalassococcus sp. S3 TaxID=2017482 RepID=UPI0010242F11|nr:lysophospholipid acyltransferase family protein [Thalassococcus sp. S3]QBF31953.1 1-acyl-sn-glycerol-3-phosphate acyltransferase [Thalassococcus sp. S3]